ncbi:MAG: sugar kinase [Pseudomonadota bacterium]
MAHSLLCLGECMIELLATGDFIGPSATSIAGDTLNTSVYAKRIGGAALHTAYCSAVGADAPSQSALNFIEQEGVDASLVAMDRKRTIGLYASMVDGDGERRFVYWRNQSAARHFFSHDLATSLSTLPAFDGIFYSAITLALMSPASRSAFFEFLDARRSNGCLVAFDSNFRPALWESLDDARASIANAWRRCDIGLPSADDETTLFGDTDDAAIIKRLADAGVSRGALKRGSRGPLLVGEPGASLSYPPVGHVIDTSAAGDSFNGAFLAKLLSGGSERCAAAAGHALAARVIQHRGAIIAFAHMADMLGE